MLEEESARLRGAALFSYSNDGIIDIDPAGVITAFNPAAERLLGHRAQDVVGSSLSLLLTTGRTPEEAAILLAKLRSLQDVEAYLAKHQHPDGRMLELSVIAVPLTHPNGSPADLQPLFEISPVFTALRPHLAASEARYRTMIESTHEGIGAINSSGELIFANSRLGEIKRL